MNVETENIVPNGSAIVTDGVGILASPTHKYISPHIGNISKGDNLDLISRKGTTTMDEERREHMAYEYLCHLEEARKWIESCIEDELPPSTELEEALRTGVILCKLGHWCAPDVLPLRKIYDFDESRFRAKGLHFKHTDNFNRWLLALRSVGLPEIFYPETTDLYDKKNMPRVIYCIHALSLYLHKLGKAPEIEDLVGTVTFTEEEISAMKRELDKYGINMPSFGKIGGILANEMSVDEAAVHAAVLAINDALDTEDHEATFEKLQNPAAMLNELDSDNSIRYFSVLKTKKKEKEQSNVTNGDITDADAYDIMLTQTEIQSCVDQVNSDVKREIAEAKKQEAVQSINQAVDSGKLSNLLNSLQSEDVNLSEVIPKNLKWYSDILSKTKKHNTECEENIDLTRQEIQDIILMANQIAEHTRLVEAAIVQVNEQVQYEDPDQILEALQNENLSLSSVNPDNIQYYTKGLQERLKEKREEIGNQRCLLNEDEIQEVIHNCNKRASHDHQALLALQNINVVIDNDDIEATMGALMNEYLYIEDVDGSCGSRYHDKLREAKKNEEADLSKEKILQVINSVNEEVRLERLLSEGVARINSILPSKDSTTLLDALQYEYVDLIGVDPDNVPHYLTLLTTSLDNKIEYTGDPSVTLSKEEIQSVIDKANNQTVDATRLAKAVSSINSCSCGSDPSLTLEALKQSDVSLRSITDECSDAYHEKLALAGQEKREGIDEEGVSGWAEHRSRDGYTYYYNNKTDKHSWTPPEGYEGTSPYLSREEIQVIVTKVTADYDRWTLLKSNEPLIIHLQSCWRGIVVRRVYRDRLEYLRAHEKEVVVLQAHLKGYLQRKAYQERLAFLRDQTPAIVKIQSLAKMYCARKFYRQRLQFFRDNVAAIIKIQAFWRAKKTKKDYKQLVEVAQPPASAVRKFLSLLEQSDLDFSEEIECQRLKSIVVQQIRSNQHLEQDLNVMDIKIGLLVKNRITLQDVVSQTDQIKKNQRRKTHEQRDEDGAGGIRGLSKTNQEKIDAYQHLFYLLQTNPHYFAKLIFEMSPNKTNQFMENVILTVLNYAHDHREQYLLVRLFETALVEEIDSKVFALKDIVTGNPTVIKMVIHFTRSESGGGTVILRELLSELVQEIINKEGLALNISPVDVYKAWINQMESETGEKSKLPYDVSNDTALEHEEVKRRIATTIQILIDATEKFQQSIMRSVNRIPYAMRYIAMRLRQALHDKFPEAPDDDVLKVVGNLLFFRYMNPAIVAPDAFDIIDMGKEKRLLEAEQRRNLGAIAKVLQHAAAGKLFEGENAALSSMNGYIQTAFQKFKQFFLEASTVEPPSSRFGYDEYTDVIMLTKPVIYISVKELIRTHSLLVEHEEALAPEPNDPLREILKDLGQIPSVEALLGGVREPIPGEDKEDIINEASKEELCLTLSNKFEGISDDDGSDMKALFVRTKRMVVDLLRVQPGDNLTHILYTPATQEQEEEHQKMITERDQKDMEKFHRTLTIKGDSMYNDRNLPLEGMKRKIMRQLRTLEQEEMVSSKNDYQDIINAIAKDIRNQHRHRQQRKNELRRLRETQEKLNQKAKFCEEQLESYQMYVKACLESLARAGGKVAGSGSEFKRQTIKYSAHRLHEKGVVLEIEGLPKHQFKNAVIEITAIGPGMFEVTGRVLGVAMDKVELVFQDLLQLQYEGVAVMKMFGRAKINVNLLIYLINKKFYGKGY